MSPLCKKRLARLKTIVSLHQEKKELLASLKGMYEWVLEGEHIFDGSWASQAEERQEHNEGEMSQLHILEEYAAMVEGALNVESKPPFQYGGLAMHEALSKIEASLEKLAKGGALLARSAASASPVSRPL